MSARAELRAAEAAPRRVAALVLPALLCELAHAQSPEKPSRRVPLAVVLTDVPDSASKNAGSEPASDELEATSVLGAVNDTARRLGVREGQTLAEARALAARLVVRGVPRSALEHGLGRIAEIALGFGAVAAFEAPDTVWVDVTGVAHLFGSEPALAAELLSRVREVGHRGRVAVADGPLVARAVARFGDIGAEGYRVVPSARTREELARLPLGALGLSTELESWFLRLGMLTLADLMALPKAALSARLEAQAPRVLELLAGRDATPLVRYEPPRSLFEEASWDDAVAGREPLLFVLRGLVARISARLSGRGEAAETLVLTIQADPKIARFRGAPLATPLAFTLPKPLHREEELRRILSSRLERVELGAPSVGLRLEASGLTAAAPRQLELGALLAGTKREALDELPIVLSELAADIGEERVGVLTRVDAHRPELCSKLVPALPPSIVPSRAGKSRGSKSRAAGTASPKPSLKKAQAPLVLSTVSPGTPSRLERVTRLLPEPVPFEAPLRVGVSVALDRRLYTIDSVHFEQRLEAVEWWNQAVSRDYVRVCLKGSDGFVEGIVYVDRARGERYWQGVLD